MRNTYHLSNKFDNNSSHNTENVEQCLLKFKPKSEYEPQHLNPDHPVEQFLNVVLTNISDPNFQESLPKNTNLTAEEHKAINSLRRNKDIIILPADKGDMSVIMNTEDYIKEAKRQLDDSSTYKLLDKDLTNEFSSEIKKYIKTNGSKEGLSEESIKLLIQTNPKTPIFYILPKIHKATIPPPGRPIVASIGSPTERISAFVDNSLQDIVKDLPSYVKNSKEFLDKLKEVTQPLPKESLLVTIDVTSLYTNILHSDGINGVKHYLEQRKSQTPSTNFLTTLIHFILSMNCFRFQESYYLQQKGTAMGTRMAPSYANLYMGKMEKDF